MIEIMDEILLENEDGEKIPFSVIETTTLGGIDYLLVEDDDEDVLILKVVDKDEDDLTIELVDDDEAKVVGKIFEELLDISIEF